ncbi:MAG: hypothetical protein [Caudoviricetes sp.]|nr:MAG: hypothetical protein [Caudoviricetes sp.]
MYKTKRQRKEAKWAKYRLANSPRVGAARRYFLGYPSTSSVLVLVTSLGEPAFPFSYGGESWRGLEERFAQFDWITFCRGGYPLTLDSNKITKEIM